MDMESQVCDKFSEGILIISQECEAFFFMLLGLGKYAMAGNMPTRICETDSSYKSAQKQSRRGKEKRKDKI